MKRLGGLLVLAALVVFWVGYGTWLVLVASGLMWAAVWVLDTAYQPRIATCSIEDAAALMDGQHRVRR